jgi:hypothetical protein
MMDDVNCLENFELGKDSYRRRGADRRVVVREKQHNNRPRNWSRRSDVHAAMHTYVLCVGDPGRPGVSYCKNKKKNWNILNDGE